ncbi:thiamine pyrophosphokinase 1 [Parasteatoda tepidariorum]|uniref:thiamine pyrophosphokinase 1 n=1 Tax=Parasteatoda tepidariorum TaxID=114398 RepID=UPI001C72999F|nr:thiamin pyrophosphokinase 1 [Parasteatoda tepidariorum]
MESKSESSIKEWFPHHIISKGEPIALLILNQPLDEENVEYLQSIWNSAAFRVAVDGGANELKDSSKNHINQTELIPDLICGDFDSALPEILDYYREKNVAVIHTPDQDETDFTKALRLTVEIIKDRGLQVSSIVALVRNGDRLDHILGNLNTLYLALKFTTLPVMILGHGSITWLLSTGSHKIHITDEMMSSHVGLVPLGKECTNVSTTGLKWNLTQDKMNFGGLISTCNLFDSNVVTVSTDTPLIWTMEVKLK